MNSRAKFSRSAGETRYGQRAVGVALPPAGADLEPVAVTIARALEEAGEALRHVAEGRAVGKVLVQVAPA